MAINPTQSNFKSFTFGGTNSRSYGVYITGQGVFNAPERNVEMVEIPGRNGAYALDKGNFNNIEITYPAGIFADNETDFANAVSDLRNFLCSQNGYVRLEDDYNPNEYRLAIYKSGLEVSHDMLIAGEFDIVFECKPQRFLTSGETAVAVANNGTINNPTLFPARPQLQVKGYGAIGIGGGTITVNNVLLGNIMIAQQEDLYDPNGSMTIASQDLDVDNLNTGDTITVSGAKLRFDCKVSDPGSVFTGTIVAINSTTNCSATVATKTSSSYEVVATIGSATFQKGTSATSTAWSTTFKDSIIVAGTNTTMIETVTIGGSIYYDGNARLTYSVSSSFSFLYTIPQYSPYFPTIWANSTKSALGNPTFIDLDIGEAWHEDSGSPVSLNNAVSIPAELPTLASGNNTITYDNTITQFKVVPRWWKV